MKRLIYFLTMIALGLFSCNPQIDFEKIVPSYVDKFATEFITQIQKGNIDTCMTLLQPEIRNENSRQFLTNSHNNVLTYDLDSFRIINARMTRMYGNNGIIIYGIDYEYNVGDKFLYFTFGIQEQNNKLLITAFDGRIMDDSLTKVHAFTLKGKGFLHYLFLFFAISIPLFILISLIFVIKTKQLKRKWLWIIGVLLGFIKFSMNWTTGQVGFSLINISILGAGYSKSGNIAPWILSFSLPIVAIIFWYKRYRDKKEAEAQKRLNERIKTMENQENNE
ncbi:hypothetical protein ACE01N_19800 [Saccharicrinis sp. FJH2]|uniref:hypothetical protein n=1 Tax=Saccharicrinis sp. FJH65 TaxID=3344659 RepID=UPI0035F4C667